MRVLAFSLCVACAAQLGACDDEPTAATVDASADSGRPDASAELGAPWVPEQSPTPVVKACYGVEGAGVPAPPPPPDIPETDSADSADSADVADGTDSADAIADAGPEPDAVVDAGPDVCATCVGAAMPAYALEDFQPQSCSYERVYGVEVFKSRPTVAVLLAAW